MRRLTTLLSTFSFVLLLSAFAVGDKTVKIQTNAVCGMCKDRIESTIGALDGVQSVRLDLTTKKVKIKYDEAKQSEASLRLAISKIGYAAADVAPDADAQAALPGCCKAKSEGGTGCSGDME